MKMNKIFENKYVVYGGIILGGFFLAKFLLKGTAQGIKETFGGATETETKNAEKVTSFSSELISPKRFDDLKKKYIQNNGRMKGKRCADRS